MVKVQSGVLNTKEVIIIKTQKSGVQKYTVFEHPNPPDNPISSCY